MNKTSTDIQKFIAGALAYIGFQALIWTVHIVLFTQSDVLTICLTVFPGLGLPIGITMFIGKERATSWARGFLAVYFLLSVGATIATRLSASPALTEELKNLVFWQSSFVLVAPVILLGLLIWCHSKRFRNEPTVT